MALVTSTSMSVRDNRGGPLHRFLPATSGDNHRSRHPRAEVTDWLNRLLASNLITNEVHSSLSTKNLHREVHVENWLRDLHQANCITLEVYRTMLRHFHSNQDSHELDPEMARPTHTETTLPSGETDDQMGLPTPMPAPYAAPTLTPAEASAYRELHNEIFQLSDHPISLGPQRRKAYRAIRSWIRRFFRGASLPLAPSALSHDAPNASNNIFLVQARIVIRPGVKRTISLLLDTGSDYNILSRDVADLFPIDLDSRRAVPFARTATGYMYGRGTLTARWWCKDGRFPSVHKSTEFHVADRKLPVDALIGWQEIIKLGIINWEPSNGFVGHFTSLNPSVDPSTAHTIEANGFLDMAAQEAQMERDEQAERVRNAECRNRANALLAAHEAQLAASNGVPLLPTRREAMFREFFDAAKSDYIRSHPR